MKRTANFWTHEPFCLESVEAKNGFCVYTNAKFARGRGISFVATPNDIQYVLQAKIFRKGLQNEATTSSPGALKYYRKASQELFLSQFTQEGRDPYIDRMDKNAFNVQMGKSRQFFSGALPETARFNHDCRPSTVYHINPETLQHQSFVVRPIKAGEEITLSYLPPYLNSTSRRNLLSQSWGFDCTCKLCTASAATKRHSDLRLLKIESIIAELNILPSKRIIDPKKAEELVRLHEQEGLWGNIGGAHMYVAMEYEVLGNRKMAKKWAGVAKESLGLLSGEGHEYHFAMKRILGEDVGSERPYARHL
ncbi:hypothetical protein EJ08DRAFT_633339 [Tothia fuscella]|uniref:SET domain-containing protein n=1 Tax=Tothia fuscella TaxID=1048955 RepID=A0A9P4NSG5_9PEZI|nr:hypothetical protein EJ08DRAFT_633339 [Tothia fuscella]